MGNNLKTRLHIHKDKERVGRMKKTGDNAENSSQMDQNPPVRGGTDGGNRSDTNNAAANSRDAAPDDDSTQANKSTRTRN